MLVDTILCFISDISAKAVYWKMCFEVNKVALDYGTNKKGIQEVNKRFLEHKH